MPVGRGEGAGKNGETVTASLSLNRGQTQEHAQCTRTRSPAAKISRANFIETIAEPLLREKKIE